MTECCNQPCPTPFCPHCGKRVELLPLEELLSHCRKTSRYATSRAQKLEQMAAEAATQKVADRRRKRATAAQRQADRWTRWADALEALLRHPPFLEDTNA